MANDYKGYVHHRLTQRTTRAFEEIRDIRYEMCVDSDDGESEQWRCTRSDYVST